MKLDGLNDSLAQAAALAANPQWILDAVRPIVALVPSTTPMSIGGSRLGGAPDLPDGTLWPTHNGGPYRFIGQINFREVCGSGIGLPRDGLLSLFVADDDDQSVFWQDADYVVALFTPATERLVRCQLPEEWAEQPGFTLRFEEAEIDLPRDDVQRTDWPDGLVGPFLDWWHAHRPRRIGHLLGYPAVSTLPYDPTPSSEWTSLLTLSSVRELGWSWHDGAFLHIFIERERLVAGDFSNLRADAG